jgi:hypothetical protein
MSEEQASALETVFTLGLSFSSAGNENEKRALVTQGIKNRQFQLVELAITEESLYDSLTFLWHMNLSIEHWVKDTQFIIDNLESVKGPDGNFFSHLNIEGFGLFGMSFGGGATGEFCKQFFPIIVLHVILIQISHKRLKNYTLQAMSLLALFGCLFIYF